MSCLGLAVAAAVAAAGAVGYESPKALPGTAFPGRSYRLHRRLRPQTRRCRHRELRCTPRCGGRREEGGSGERDGTAEGGGDRKPGRTKSQWWREGGELGLRYCREWKTADAEDEGEAGNEEDEGGGDCPETQGGTLTASVPSRRSPAGSDEEGGAMRVTAGAG